MSSVLVWMTGLMVSALVSIGIFLTSPPQAHLDFRSTVWMQPGSPVDRYSHSKTPATCTGNL
ncbi:hypothetical protein BDW74DRAFT_142293 [Aspergillus multicolor]|uniref:uncharacterized protein n=1 Tax=Aspergillus multicolor TaxID=41759 RepID=UPI003CCDDA12